MRENFPRNLGNRAILVFFREWIMHNRVILVAILHHNGHLQQQWRWILISLGLMHNLHKRRIQWLEAMEKWPCGDSFTFYSVVLRDDVLIENNNYGCVIMQNNGAMKIVNFTHAQTAETRCSFLCLWTSGTRLGMWPTFQKKPEGVGKRLVKPTVPEVMQSLHIPFIDHLSRDTSGFICGLFGTCELC